MTSMFHGAVKSGDQPKPCWRRGRGTQSGGISTKPFPDLSILFSPSTHSSPFCLLSANAAATSFIHSPFPSDFRALVKSRYDYMIRRRETKRAPLRAVTGAPPRVPALRSSARLRKLTVAVRPECMVSRLQASHVYRLGSTTKNRRPSTHSNQVEFSFVLNQLQRSIYIYVSLLCIFASRAVRLRARMRSPAAKMSNDTRS
jgi:hypothetical protein